MNATSGMTTTRPCLPVAGLVRMDASAKPSPTDSKAFFKTTKMSVTEHWQDGADDQRRTL